MLPPIFKSVGGIAWRLGIGMGFPYTPMTDPSPSYFLGQGSALLAVDNVASLIHSVGGTCGEDNVSEFQDKVFLAVVLIGIANAIGRYVAA